MEKLEALASISRLSGSVVRVLGQNPGKFTLQGTNTYIIGRQNPYILVDTGEGRDEYIPFLESALQDVGMQSNPSEPDVSDIIISHWHHDHVGGLPSVLALLRRLWDKKNTSTPFNPPRLHKFPQAADALPPLEGRDTLSEIVRALPTDLYKRSPDGKAFHDLHDDQTFSFSSSIRVLHTPGHTTDSICLYIAEDRALYTADTVLGQGTAVFEDLGTYIASLKKMLEFNESKGSTSADHGPKYELLYPGHGPVVSDGPKVISTYIKHRLEREDQIVQVLKSAPTSIAQVVPAHWTTWTIVSTIYAAYPESLWLPAAHSVNLHLAKLESEGRVRKLGGEGKDTVWEFSQSSSL